MQTYYFNYKKKKKKKKAHRHGRNFMIFYFQTTQGALTASINEMATQTRTLPYVTKYKSTF